MMENRNTRVLVSVNRRRLLRLRLFRRTRVVLLPLVVHLLIRPLAYAPVDTAVGPGLRSGKRAYFSQWLVRILVLARDFLLHVTNCL